MKNLIRNIKMTRSNYVASYLMKINHVKDALVAIEDKIKDSKLITIAQKKIPSPWEPFIQEIYGGGKLPSFDELWDECIQEETRLLDKP